MGFLHDIFDFIGNLFNKILETIKRVLPYILLAAAVYWGFGGTAFLSTIFGPTMTGGAAAAIAVGASFLLAPEETVALIDRTAQAVGQAATAIVEAAVPVLQAVGDGLWSVLSSSPIFWALAGYLGYKVFLADDNKRKTAVEHDQQPAPGSAS